MTNHKAQTPADVIANQLMTIERAVKLLQRHADAVGHEDALTWQDVSKLAKAADVARTVLEHFEGDED